MLFEGNQTILNIMQQGSQMSKLTMLRQCLACTCLAAALEQHKEIQSTYGRFLKDCNPKLKYFPFSGLLIFYQTLVFMFVTTSKVHSAIKKNSLLSTLPLWYKWEDIINLMFFTKLLQSWLSISQGQSKSFISPFHSLNISCNSCCKRKLLLQKFSKEQ